ncbi:MAG: hypothetical protein UR54_C0006G0015 [Candidatus Roizmanbacteria bacterium GW2011_GWA2_34_18]|uniref:Uncharacterized protein n=1 Tax=Candidatus Roizmanbacteria bacterium GW2011_GWA2_34_18 TaxID=1618477 RepID=A0A0G0E0V3_9BACT|nr:MAG: hypothetical protein UR54_C0006G0015 [Candidatus Roizmanbacteria bacterium GW2011_GWA2_34_18]
MTGLTQVEAPLITPKKDFPSQAKELGVLGQDYSLKGAVGMKPYKPSLFPFPGGSS